MISAKCPHCEDWVYLCSSPLRWWLIAGPVEPEEIPWQVPLDQTTAPIHYEGDTSSV